MPPRQPDRHSIRLPAYEYASPGAYFVTMVTKGRACLFGDIHDGMMVLSPRGRIAEECWRTIPAHFPHVELGTYVVMPNHVHGILILHEHDDRADGTSARRGTIYRAPTTVEGFQKPVTGSVPTIVRTYKAAVTRLIRQPVWQRGFYEHVIRDDRDWDRTRRYIEANPTTWDDDEER